MWQVGLVAVLVFYLFRFFNCLPNRERSCKRTAEKVEKGLHPVVTPPLSCMVIFGSGGHTTEMLRMIQHLSPSKYSPIYFILAHVSDLLSLSCYILLSV